MTGGLKDVHREAIIAVIAANDRVERAVLFGSRATGTNTVSSDVDIALFGDQLTLTDQARLVAALDEIPMAQSVDLILYDSIRNRTLQEHIRDHGIEWLGRPEARHGNYAAPPFDTGAPEPSENWSTMPFTEAFLINPAVPIEHGIPTPFVDMAAVEPNLRAVRATRVRKFRGSGSKFQHGDTLFARITPCLENGKIARYHANSDLNVGHGSTEFIVVRGRSGVTETEYAFYVARSDLVRGYAISQMTGTSGRQRVPAESLAHLDVAVPPLPDQRAIAHILGTLDDKIGLNRRMNETLEAMSRALFKSWFVDFDPVRAKMEGRDTGLPHDIADLFPDRLVDSELGEMPEGWKVSEIGKEVSAVGGSTPSTKEPSYWHQGQHHWATPRDLSKLWSPVLLQTRRKITDAGLAKIGSGLLPVGTVLMSSRAPIGYLAIAEVPTAVNQGFVAMRCDQRLPNLYVLFWCYENLGYIRDIAGGSTFAEISKNAFRPVSVLVPSEAILCLYERLSRPLYDQVVTRMKEAATLATLRDTLLPRLISGEIRVRDTLFVS